MILSGHPTGNPNSHQAFRAFADAGQLYGICVPWLPSEKAIRFLSRMPYFNKGAARLSRRRFDASEVRIIDGKIGEMCRLAQRTLGFGSERLSYQANDWLMKTAQYQVTKPIITAVHSYEDCSLLQFQASKMLGKACIYDMPIGYYPAWQSLHAMLTARYSEWIKPDAQIASRWVRPIQKTLEMELADLVLVPSDFVANTVREQYATKEVSVVRYGIDTSFWHVKERKRNKKLNFLYAGACSVRKGVPLLLEAWKAARLKDAKLTLVGGWHLDADRLGDLPSGVAWSGPVDPIGLRNHLWDADCLVAPTFFEGRALIIGEAMATGIPVITTTSSGCEDLVGKGCGRILPPGNLEALVSALRWASVSYADIVQQGIEARSRSEKSTWGAYRTDLSAAVAAFI